VISAGIDAGSRTVKVILLDAGTSRVIASGLADQGTDPEAVARGLFDQVLSDHALARDGIGHVVATGYARHAIANADTTITEITCQARGVRHLLPEARTIVEIGGQDSKVIRLNPDGSVRDFAMNDRCAAGCGRFLEMLAARFGVGLPALGDLASGSDDPASINSTCVVFAETEIIGLLAQGAAPADIAAGVQSAIASRAAALAAGRASPPVAFTGGVALVPNMPAALSAALDHPVIVPPQPQFTGALGAALLAAGAGS
jgi:predicted CoA-substrate-specific enzyme activase